VRVAAVQFKGDRARLDDRRAALAGWIWGVGPGADMVVCPELAVSGYFFSDPAEARLVSEPADGPTFQALSPVARALRTWVVCGFVEADRDRLFNSAMVLRPDGTCAFVYRKTLLFEADEIWASPGDSGYATFDTGSGSFGVGICMDLNDDGFLAWVERSRPSVLAFPTNWIEEGLDVWSYWAARLSGTGVALVAANSWGPEGTERFTGRSAILQPDVDEGPGAWWVLAGAEPTGDALIQARLLPRSR
jgi:predicted amidohydrolase